jgi:hypothetical protein
LLFVCGLFSRSLLLTGALTVWPGNNSHHSAIAAAEGKQGAYRGEPHRHGVEQQRIVPNRVVPVRLQFVLFRFAFFNESHASFLCCSRPTAEPSSTTLAVRVRAAMADLAPSVQCNSLCVAPTDVVLQLLRTFAANGRVSSVALFRRLVRCALALKIAAEAPRSADQLLLTVDGDGSVAVGKGRRMMFGQLFSIALYGGGEDAYERSKKLRVAASAVGNDDEEEGIDDEQPRSDDDAEEATLLKNSSFTSQANAERKRLDSAQLEVLDACAQSVYEYVERDSER